MAVATQGRGASVTEDRHPVLVACDALQDGLPALAESRGRVLDAARAEQPSRSAIVEAIEADVAVVIAVLREANERRPRGRSPIYTVPRAVDVLEPEGVALVAEGMPVVDFFHRLPGCDVTPDALRQHSVATQQAADRLATTVEGIDRDELSAAAVLHDVGKAPLCAALPQYAAGVGDHGGTPEQRLRAERARSGVDHAVVGAYLLRRWGLPERLAQTVAAHHDPEAKGVAALVRLGDMLAHYAHGDAVDPAALQQAATLAGVPDDELRAQLQRPVGANRASRDGDPCPLTRSELDALRAVAQGKALKEIAHERGRSASTIRSQLHGCYEKLGVNDRAQAVLIAAQQGWL